MSDNQQNDVQDPAEPYKADQAVETSDQPEPSGQSAVLENAPSGESVVPTKETRVETSVTEQTIENGDSTDA